MGILLERSSSHVRVVVSDFSVVLMGRIARQPLTPNDYATWNYEPLPPPGSSHRLVDLYDVPRTHRLARFGDLNVANRIVSAAERLNRHPFVRHARDVSTRNFTTGNYVILGTPRSTPWSGPFERQLNFQIVQRGAAFGYLNRSPRPGEKPDYLVLETVKEWGPG